MKQAIIVRKDLGMGVGKIVAQASHASLESALKVMKSYPDNFKEWKIKGQKKIVLKVNSEKELVDVFNKAKKSVIGVSLIRDAGLTQLAPGTKTAVGMGPDKDEKIDRVIKDLKLL